MVTVITANIREAPNNTSGVIRIASEGMSLQVYGRVGGWMRVGDGSGPWGWIHATLVRPAS
jgi:SH3-like domain-containing protein